MIISPRLTRAALTFLLFGTVAALLPSPDTTALADVLCTPNPKYVMRLTTNTASSTKEAASTLVISHPGPITLAAFVSVDGGTSFKAASTTNFSGRGLTFTLENTGAAGRFNMGSTASDNPVTPGKSADYLPATLHATGLYANQASMTGTVSAKFNYKGITLVDSRALTSN